MPKTTQRLKVPFISVPAWKFNSFVCTLLITMMLFGSRNSECLLLTLSHVGKKICNNREFPPDFISEKVLSFLLFCYCWEQGQSVSEEEEKIVLNWVLWSFPHIFLPICFLQLKLIASLIMTSTQLTHLISCLQRRQNLHRFVRWLNQNANVFSVNIYCHHFVAHRGAFCGL